MSTTITAISELTQSAQKACNLFLAECEAQGLKVRITETYRSQARQNELYAQGRTTPGQIVTWTKNSRHMSRRAWDICQNIKGQEYSNNSFFKKCGNVAHKFGITWGGDWGTPDLPHFEISENWNYVEKGDEPMTAAEKNEMNVLEKRITSLEQTQKIYHYTQEIPEWGRSTIQKLLDKGIYSGASNADLNLPETLLRVLVINDRAGLYSNG